jgi:hypothetical protein
LLSKRALTNSLKERFEKLIDATLHIYAQVRPLCAHSIKGIRRSMV